MSWIGEKASGLKDLAFFDNFWQLLFNRTFGRKTGLTLYRKGAMQILVDHHGGDQSGTRMCLVSDMYRSLLQDALLPKEINVLDLGANGGGFPLLLMLEGLVPAKLVCVEMNPQTFNRLRFNLGENAPGGSVALNAAVCGEEEVLKLRLGRGGTGDSIRAGRQGGPSDGEEVEVPGVTVDGLMSAHFRGAQVDLCKMDVEGAEYDVILGDHSGSLRQVRYLVIEIHDREGRSHEDVAKRLGELGFEERSRWQHPEEDVRLFERRD